MAVLDKKQLLEEHYRENSSKLVKIATYRLKDPHIAQDAVQEAYAKALRYLDRYDIERDFGGWFTRIFNNACTDMQAFARGQGINNEEGRVEHEGLDYVSRKELYLWIQQERKKIHRELLTMFFFEGFNSRQVSEFLGLTHSNVRQIINRFRDKLIEAPAGVD